MSEYAQNEQPEQNPALKSLDILSGEWNLEGSLPPDPTAILHGHASFQWLENGAFLLYRSSIDRPEFPRTTAMIGPDDSIGRYTMLYFDSRGYSRIYEMRLGNGVWELQRKAPGFSQRFIGNFNDDHDMITCRWEKSKDGSNWEHDFDLTYKRIKM